VFLPSPADGVLYALNAVTGEVLWAYPASSPMSSDTVVVAGGRVVWNAGDRIAALDASTGDLLWETAVPIGNGALAVANGYVWGAGTGHLVAVRLSDGFLAQDKASDLLASVSGKLAVSADAGGVIVVNAGAKAVAFANSTLPMPPGGIQVEEQEESLLVTWDPPMPSPDEQPVQMMARARSEAMGPGTTGVAMNVFVLIREEAPKISGTNAAPPPPVDLQKRTVIVDMGTKSAKVVEIGKPVGVLQPGQIVASFPSRSGNPGGVVAPLVRDTDDGQYSFQDKVLNTGQEYSYGVFVVNMDGKQSAVARSKAPAKMKFTPKAKAGKIRSGADWLFPGCTADRLGWNEAEMMNFDPNTQVGGEGNHGFSPFRKKFDFIRMESAVDGAEIRYDGGKNGFNIRPLSPGLTVSPSGFEVFPVSHDDGVIGVNPAVFAIEGSFSTVNPADGSVVMTAVKSEFSLSPSGGVIKIGKTSGGLDLSGQEINVAWVQGPPPPLPAAPGSATSGAWSLVVLSASAKVSTTFNSTADTRVRFTEPVVSGGLVYAGGSDGKVYCLHAETGATQWYNSTFGAVRYPPVIVRKAGMLPDGKTGNAGERLLYVSDDGNLYKLDIPPYPQDRKIFDVVAIGGTPLCAPTGDGDTLARRWDGVILLNGEPLPGNPKNPGAFFGPNSRLGRVIVLVEGDGIPGKITVPGRCEIAMPEPGKLNPNLVRPSNTPFGAGPYYDEEILVAGFRLKWYGLVMRQSSDSMYWKQCFYCPTTKGGDKQGPIGGLVAKYGYGGEGLSMPLGCQDGTFSSVEAASLGSFYSWNYPQIEGRTSTRALFSRTFQGIGLVPPGGMGGVAAGDLAAAWPSGVAFTKTIQGSTSFPGSTVYDNTSQNCYLSQTRGSCLSCPDTYSSLDHSHENLAQFGEWPSVMACGTLPAPLPSPTRLNFVQPLVPGMFVARAKYLYGDTDWMYPRADGTITEPAVITRGQAFVAGDVLSGYGWMAPLAPLAVAPMPDLNGDIKGVSVIWTPSPALTGTGTYGIYRKGLPPYPDIFTLVGTVSGGDSRSFFDDTVIRPEQFFSVQYYVRAQDSALPGYGSEPDYGLSLPIEVWLARPDSITIEEVPPIITQDQRALFTVTVKMGSDAVPGIPVRVTKIPGANGTMKSSPDDPGTTSSFIDLVTDQEGKAYVIYEPSRLGIVQSAVLAAAIRAPFAVGTPEPTARVEIYPTYDDAVNALPWMGDYWWPWSSDAVEGMISDRFGALIEYTCMGSVCSVPINTLVGALNLSVTDLELESPGFKLGFRRSYSNFLLPRTALGWGWTCNYFSSLEEQENGDILFHQWNGSIRRYERHADGSYGSPTGVFDSLVKMPDGSFDIRSNRGFTLSFDSAGQLAKLRDRNGNTQSVLSRGGYPVRITDSAGQYLEISYDLKGRVSVVSDSTGRRVEYSYDGGDNLVSVVRPGAETATYEYTPAHLVSKIADPAMPSGSKRESFVYDALHRVREVYDGEGNKKHTLAYLLLPDGTSKTTITSGCCGPRIDEYDQRGLISRQVDALGQATEFGFDANLRRTRIRDRNGNQTTMQYDQRGNLFQVNNPLGGVMTMVWEPVFNMPSVFTDELGRVTRYEQDRAGNTTAVVDALGGRTIKAYDGHGLLRSITDALGNTTRISYDLFGNIISVADALGRTTSNEYNPQHWQIRRIDAKGRSTSFIYDDRGRRTEVHLPDGAINRSEFDEWNRQVRAIDPLGNATKSEYDRDDRRVSVTDASGGQTRYQFDAQGNLLSITDANSHVTRHEYNDLNWLVRTISPLGQTTSRVYDANGNILSVTDSAGFITSYSYDRLNRLVAVTDAKGAVTRVDYDAAGNTVKETDANGHETKMVYDSLNRRTGITDPLGRTTSMTYNAVGQVIEMKDARNKPVIYLYDAVGQMLSRRHDGEEDTWTYDEAGNVATSSGKSLSVSCQYDSRDRMVQISYTEKGLAYGHSYDLAGRMTSVKYPEGETLEYKYNQTGRLTELVDSKQGTIRVEYDSEGKRTRQVWPNGLSTKWEYDSGDRLTGILPEQTKKVPSITYTYDLRDNRLTMNRSDSGINRYQYDAISQLTKAELPWGDTQEYSYDLVGNRLEMKDKRGIQWYKYDYGDQLLEIESTFNPEGNDMNLALQAKATVSDETPPRFKTTFIYDGAGNQVAKTGPGKKVSKYSFDSLNRMVGMDAPGSAPQINTFDTQDRRIGIAGGESEGKTFLRGACGSAILIEVSGKGKVTDRYIVMPNGRLVGRVETSGNKVSWYHFDALGNVIATSDKAGKITSTHEYEPFGASRSTPPDKDMYGFVGEWGVETKVGVHRMGVRFYGYEYGAFISRDPFRYDMNILDMSSYVYANNNPLTNTDPEGLQAGVPDYNAMASQAIGQMAEATWVCGKKAGEMYIKNVIPAFGCAALCNGVPPCIVNCYKTIKRMMLPITIYRLFELAKTNPIVKKLLEEGRNIPRNLLQ
jgi:RHS repeat-associated protein